MNRSSWTGAALFAAVLLSGSSVFAHCDGMDGPVVTAARQALESGEVNRVLMWVREADEAEIRQAFEHTLAVRKLSTEARQLADLYFFETLVRVHRAGEGAPYTGLKPAGRDIGPAIPAADRALESGSADALLDSLTRAVRDGVHERFARAAARHEFDPHDLAAGRSYVAAYVDFIHYVERVHQAATNPDQAHPHAEPHEQ